MGALSVILIIGTEYKRKCAALFLAAMTLVLPAAAQNGEKQNPSGSPESSGVPSAAAPAAPAEAPAAAHGIKPVFPVTVPGLVYVEGEDSVSTNMAVEPTMVFSCSGKRTLQLSEKTQLLGGASYYAEYCFYIEAEGDYEFWYGGTPPEPRDELLPAFASPFSVSIDEGQPRTFYREDVHVAGNYTPAYYWVLAGSFHLGAGSHTIRFSVTEKRRLDSKYFFYLDSFFFATPEALAVKPEERQGYPEVFPENPADRSLDNPFRSFEDYQTDIQNNPSRIASYIELSSEYSLAGDYVNALKYLGRAAIIAPQNPTLRLLQAKNRSWRGDTKEAIDAYGIYLSLRPDDLGIYEEAGKVSAWAGRLSDSEYFYRKALEAFQGNPSLTVNLGLTLLWAGRVGEAENCFAAAAKKALETPEGASELASIYRENGFPDRARSIYEQAVAAFPDHLGLYLDEEALLAATGAEAEEKALEARILSTFEPSAELDARLSSARAQRELKSRRIADFEAKVAADPGNLELRDELTRIYAWNGRRADAARELESILAARFVRELGKSDTALSDLEAGQFEAAALASEADGFGHSLDSTVLALQAAAKTAEKGVADLSAAVKADADAKAKLETAREYQTGTAAALSQASAGSDTAAADSGAAAAARDTAAQASQTAAAAAKAAAAQAQSAAAAAKSAASDAAAARKAAAKAPDDASAAASAEDRATQAAAAQTAADADAAAAADAKAKAAEAQAAFAQASQEAAGRKKNAEDALRQKEACGKADEKARADVTAAEVAAEKASSELEASRLAARAALQGYSEALSAYEAEYGRLSAFADLFAQIGSVFDAASVRAQADEDAYKSLAAGLGWKFDPSAESVQFAAPASRGEAVAALGRARLLLPRSAAAARSALSRFDSSALSAEFSLAGLLIDARDNMGAVRKAAASQAESAGAAVPAAAVSVTQTQTGSSVSAPSAAPASSPGAAPSAAASAPATEPAAGTAAPSVPAAQGASAAAAPAAPAALPGLSPACGALSALAAHPAEAETAPNGIEDLAGFLESLRSRQSADDAAALTARAEALEHLRTARALVARGSALEDEALERAYFAFESGALDLRAELASYYDGLGRSADSAGQYARILAMDPGNIKALYNLGLAEEKAGDWHSAQKRYAAVYATDPYYGSSAALYNAIARRESSSVSVTAGLVADSNYSDFETDSQFYFPLSSRLSFSPAADIRNSRNQSQGNPAYLAAKLVLEAAYSFNTNSRDSALILKPRFELSGTSVDFASDGATSVSPSQFLGALSVFSGAGLALQWNTRLVNTNADYSWAPLPRSIDPSSGFDTGLYAHQLELSSSAYFPLGGIFRYFAPRLYAKAGYVPGDSGNIFGTGLVELNPAIKLTDVPWSNLGFPLTLIYEDSLISRTVPYYGATQAFKALFGPLWQQSRSLSSSGEALSFSVLAQGGIYSSSVWSDSGPVWAPCILAFGQVNWQRQSTDYTVSLEFSDVMSASDPLGADPQYWSLSITGGIGAKSFSLIVP